jgi:hypothetical protein
MTEGPDSGGGTNGGGGTEDGPGRSGVRRFRRWLCSPLVGSPQLQISTARPGIEVGLVYVAFFGVSVVNAVLSIFNLIRLKSPSWASASSGALGTVLESGLAVVVVLLFSQRRGLSAADLGLSLRPLSAPVVPGMSRARSWLAAFSVALTGHMAFALVSAPISTAGYNFGPHSGTELFGHLVGSVKAGVVEETVVLGFVVVTLAQARLPLWQVAGWAILLRGLYHLYYGPGALGVIVWVPIAMAVFWWTRSLFPLIAAHVLWDVQASLSKWAAVTACHVLTVVLWSATVAALAYALFTALGLVVFWQWGWRPGYGRALVVRPGRDPV